MDRVAQCDTEWEDSKRVERRALAFVSRSIMLIT